MNLSHIFSKEHHAACKWLGTKDWLKLNVDEDGSIDYHIEDNLYISETDNDRFHPADISNAHRLLQSYAASNAACCFFLATFSKMLADGPKLYQPTLEHCLAMQHTECSFEFDYYQQPYPVTLIELPKEYLQQIKHEFDISVVPRYVFCYRHETGVIAAAAWFGPHNSVVNTLAPRADFKTVEDAIRANTEIILPTYGPIDDKSTDVDYKVADLVQRLALNFSMALVLGGCKVQGPLSGSHDKHVRALKNPKANIKKKERARDYMLAPVYVIGFEQETSFYDIEHEPATGDNREGSHASPKPHWRRGFYRKQHYGPQNSLTKVVYIKPVMVMKHLFVGDVSNTSATYKLKDKSPTDKKRRRQ